MPEKENYHIESVLRRLEDAFSPCLRAFRNYCAVSLIGAGITDCYDYLCDSLSLLRERGIRTAGLHTSSFRISLLVERPALAEVVRLFHRHFIEKQPE